VYDSYIALASTPAAMIVVAATPSYAVQYLTVGAAQKLCFSQSETFTESHVVFTPAQIHAIEQASGHDSCNDRATDTSRHRLGYAFDYQRQTRAPAGPGNAGPKTRQQCCTGRLHFEVHWKEAPWLVVLPPQFSSRQRLLPT